MDRLIRLCNDQTFPHRDRIIELDIKKVNDVNLIKKEILKKNTCEANYIVARAYLIIENDEFAYEFFLKEGAKKNNLTSIKHLILFYKEKELEEETEKYKKLRNELLSKKSMDGMTYLMFY